MISSSGTPSPAMMCPPEVVGHRRCYAGGSVQSVEDARAAVAWACWISGRTSRWAASSSRPSRPAAPSTPYPIAPRTTRARTTTTIQTISSSTGATLTGGADRRRCVDSVPAQRSQGVGGDLRGQGRRLVDPRPAAEGGDQPPRPGDVRGVHGDGETAVLEGGGRVDRVVVGDP